MLDYLSSLPDFYLFLLLSLIAIFFSIFIIWFFKDIVPIHLRYKDNGVVGNISSLIGIVYGVLAGLTALYLINNISYTADAVQREANAVADVYRDTSWLQEPLRSKIQANTKTYLTNVINVEWPLMRQGKKLNLFGESLIDEMMENLRVESQSQTINTLIMQDLLENIKTLYNARQQRIQMSHSSLNPDIWFVLLLGTVLTIAVNYLFGMSFYLHIATVSAAALMCSSMIFLILTLDRPFQGEFIIEPDAFQSVLALIDKNSLASSVKG